MIPILYSENETAFESQGLGALPEATSCIVEEELNGAYTLSLKYPVNGKRFQDIQERRIIFAKPSPNQDPQPFRIFGSRKVINGVATYKANHISYDMSNYIVTPFYFNTIGEAFNQANGVLSYTIPTDIPFSLATDKQLSIPLSSDTPQTLRSILGGVEGSILDTYRGEWEFDRYTCYLHNRRGMDRGAVIRWGKNLTDYSQDVDWTNVYTHIYPYWKDDETGVIVTVEDQIVPVGGTFNFTKILPVDFSQDFEVAPTNAELLAAAQNYISNRDLGVPSDSKDISFVQLSKSPEYSEYLPLLERIDIGDSVKVIYERYGVSGMSRVVKATYNVLLDRYDTLTIGDVKASISDRIVEQEKKIEERPTRTIVEAITDALGKALVGGFGGAIRMLDTDLDGMPDTFYIADNPDPNLATKVWRWNYLGWAVSGNGYNGDYRMGATLEDGLLAEFVTAANLRAGTIESADNGDTFYLDLTNGVLRMKASSILIGNTNLNDAIAQSQQDIQSLFGEQSELQQYLYRDPSTGVITIGDANNEVRMVLLNNQLSFVTGPSSNPTVVAYFSDNKLKVDDISVASSIELGKWKIFTDSDDGFGIKWIGG